MWVQSSGATSSLPESRHVDLTATVRFLVKCATVG